MLFSCSTDKPKEIVKMISTAVWRQEDQIAVLEVDETGFKFEVTDSCSSVINVLIPAEYFTSYCFIEEEKVRMTISISKLLRCMSIFADSAVDLTIRAKERTKLEIEVTEANSSTICTLKTLTKLPKAVYPEVMNDFSAIISTDALHELFRIIGTPNEIVLSGYTVSRLFTISTHCGFGDTSAEMRNTLGEFSGTGRDVRSSFTYSSLLPLIKALSILDGGDTAVKMSSTGTIEAVIKFSGNTAFKARVEPMAD